MLKTFVWGHGYTYLQRLDWKVVMWEGAGPCIDRFKDLEGLGSEISCIH